MKISYKIAAVALMLGFAVQANAQGSASATAASTATVVEAITLTKTADLAFGNVVPDALAISTVTVGTTDNASVGGGALLAGGTVSSAAFTVGGSDEAYTITVPTTAVTLSNGTPAEDMTLTAFIDSGSGTGTIASGADTFTVGATLNLAAAQAQGDYAGSFSVTVAYQ